MTNPVVGDTQDPRTTHRAIVECAVPPSIEFVASGPRQWCVDRLTEWTERHPTPQYSGGYVVEIQDEVICEPGVGVYSVPVGGVLPSDPPTDAQEIGNILLAGYERGEVSLMVLAQAFGLPPDDMQERAAEQGYWVGWLTPLLTEASGAAHGHLNSDSLRSVLKAVPDPFLRLAGLTWAIES